MATITKTQLEARVAELQAALAVAQGRNNDLEQQLEAQASEAQEPERRDQLEQVVWIQRDCPSFDRDTMRWSRDGKTLILEIATQYSSLDRRTGQRVYGARKWFTAIGELAERIRDHYESGSDVRLVRIGAYEKPQLPEHCTRNELTERGFSPRAQVRGSLVGHLEDGTPVYETALTGDNGEKLFRIGEPRSEWMLSHFKPLPRLDAPAQPVQAAASAPVAAGYGEPTDEEVPF
jgi:hypothetical protein